MATQNVLTVGTAPVLALIQRSREEAVIHIEYEGADRAVIGSFLEILDQAEAELTLVDRAINALAVDSDLSDAGKTKRAVEIVGKAYGGHLQLVRKAWVTKRAAADEAKARLTAVPKAQTDATVDYFQGYEIRQRLSRLPVSERMTIFAQAVATKNAAVQRALANDPLHEELIPGEYIERVVQEHAQQSESLQWRRLEALEFISDRLQTLHTALDLNLKGYGTIPAFEGKTVRHVDLKQGNPHTPPDKGPADEPPSGTPQFK